MRLFTLALLVFLAHPAMASVSGRVGNHSSYFLDDERLRHHRYEIGLTHKTSFSFRSQTILEGRLRYDAAIREGESAPFQGISEAAREDELAEAELRQAYYDYLGDYFRLNVGLQKIDWVESLSPTSNDILTPLDLRHGGFGDAADLIVPMGALSLNHKFFTGSLEWLVVPFPAVSKLPEGRNGYGFFDTIEANVEEDVTINLTNDDDISGETELGLRYLLTYDKAEVTLFAYRGHQRQPVLEVREDGDESFGVRMTYPESTTMGFFWSYADDALVLRFMGFYEPDRQPDVVTLPNLLGEEPYQTRSRAGVGFDYVYNKHLKVYTEQFWTVTEDFPKPEVDTGDDSDDTDTGLPLALMATQTDDRARDQESKRQRYTAVMRLTNETFKDVELVGDGIYHASKKAHYLGATAKFTFADSWKWDLGVRLVRSADVASVYEPIKKSSNVWTSVFWSF